MVMTPVRRELMTLADPRYAAEDLHGDEFHVAG
jgi:hypothetical protein